MSSILRPFVLVTLLREFFFTLARHQNTVFTSRPAINATSCGALEISCSISADARILTSKGGSMALSIRHIGILFPETSDLIRDVSPHILIYRFMRF